jgi:SET domain-containing protein
MLTVKTRVHLSPIEGLGLFANEIIRAGQIIWEFHPIFDTTYSQEEFERLPGAAKPHIRKYSYFCPEKQKWILCGDDARFMNHSDTPNTFEEPGNRTIAVRDIAIGEELTCDYRQFDARSFLEEEFVPAGCEALHNGYALDKA